VNTKRTTIILSVLLCAAGSSQSLAITYTTIDYPGSTETSAIGIDGGNIVGNYQDLSGEHGFLYDGTKYTPFDVSLAQPYGIDVSGISGNNIVGTYLDLSGITHGFLYNDISATYTTFDDPKGTGTNGSTIGSGIDGGNIVGAYYDAANVSHGFVYDGTKYTTLNDPLGTIGTSALGISGNNIVGDYSPSSNDVHPFLYDGTKYTTFDSPGSINTYAIGISGTNVVGYFGDSSGQHGFLYDYNSAKWTTLDYPLAGASGAIAAGISSGRIVGSYVDSSFVSHGFLATVPEPSTLALLLAGMLMMCGRRRPRMS
jgi:hypothetical protein